MIAQIFRAGQLLTRGQRLVAQQRFSEALPVFAQAVALRPRAAGLYLHQALALSEAGRLAEATTALQQAMALQPANPVLPMFLAQICFDHADYATARHWCERALTLNPHNSHAMGLSALLELAQGQIQQGTQRLQAVLPLPVPWLERGALWLTRSRIPSLLQQANTALQSRVLVCVETYLLQHQATAHPLAQQLIPSSTTETWGGRVVTALDRLLTRLVLGGQRLYTLVRYAAQPAARASQYLRLQAEEAFYLGNLEQAKRLYTRLLRQAPEPWQFQQALCDIACEQGRFRQALTHLQALQAQAPDHSLAAPGQAALLGELHYLAGAYPAAAQALAPAVTNQWRDYKVFYYLGLCALRTDRPQTARHDFARAVACLHPDMVTKRVQEMARVAQRLAGPSGATPTETL
jgi:tetratricopeptide (TPR) repeat protein